MIPNSIQPNITARYHDHGDYTESVLCGPCDFKTSIEARAVQLIDLTRYAKWDAPSVVSGTKKHC